MQGEGGGKRGRGGGREEGKFLKARQGQGRRGGGRDKEGKGLGQDKEITKKGKGQEHGGRIRILEVWWSSD